MSQATNERMVAVLLDNLSLEKAIIAIAQAITCRDEIIEMSRDDQEDAAI